MARPRSFDYHEAAHRFKAGETVPQLAQAYEVTPEHIRRAIEIATGEEVNFRRISNRRRRHLSDEDVAFAIVLKSQGFSWRELGKQLDIPVTSLRMAIDRYQVEMAEKRAAMMKEDDDG